MYLFNYRSNTSFTDKPYMHILLQFIMLYPLHGGVMYSYMAEEEARVGQENNRMIILMQDHCGGLITYCGKYLIM